jgi:uncharacterized protein YjiK
MKNSIKKGVAEFLAFGILFYLLAIDLAEVVALDLNQGSVNHDLAAYNFQAETIRRWKLPKRLREISGLAMTHDQRLLAHNDEKGTIYEIDYRQGSIIKAFKLADLDTSVKDDFEGIATDSNWVYLVTSSGRLYEFSEGADKQTVPFNVYATGVGQDCEIEGLAYEPNDRALLLMCKKPRSLEQKKLLTIYRWSVDSKRLIEGAHTAIPTTEFTRHIKGKTFQPSGIERHPESGNYFVVAARQRAIAEITPGGQVLAVIKFARKWHRQVEGITFTQDHTLIVAGEGEKKRANLTLYPVSIRGN